MSENNKKKYDEMVERLMAYENHEHARYQKKLKIGIRLLWIIPLIFLFIMFITDSNKVIFLVFWIASLFAIACYLILVEYHDYQLQHAMDDISGEQREEMDTLLDVDLANEKMQLAAATAKERIEARVEELKL